MDIITGRAPPPARAESQLYKGSRARTAWAVPIAWGPGLQAASPWELRQYGANLASGHRFH